MQEREVTEINACFSLHHIAEVFLTICGSRGLNGGGTLAEWLAQLSC
jgi:hypothetical protein